MVDNKRKKYHDKDKYYRLAKEQGLRSRAAFKLSQINRKFSLLEQACGRSSSSSSGRGSGKGGRASATPGIVLDLCAAPGGWTQIVARMTSSSSGTNTNATAANNNVHIIAVDILPIRSFVGLQHKITTLIGDITTDKCKSEIRHAVKQIYYASNGSGSNKDNNNNNKDATTNVDLILHDGAPNVGADYGKDAYVQNEMSVHALRVCVAHLKRGGNFVTKIYRSRDYASYVWLLQQLFTTVEAYKPKASRTASAEIFLVAQHYKAPDVVDPRLLDPKHIFSIVEGDTSTGGNNAGDGSTSLTNATEKALWKRLDAASAGGKKPRQRGGYDMTHYDASMQHVESVRQMLSSTMKDAIYLLSISTSLQFTCRECRRQQAEGGQGRRCQVCSMIYHHPLTSTEIKQCCADLKVLNRTDFKELMKWRSQMQPVVEKKTEFDSKDGDSGSDGEDNKKKRKAGGDDDSASDDDDASSSSDSDNSSSDDEEMIQSEIEEMKRRRLRERKRQKKKERAVAAKRRQRAALSGDMQDLIDDVGNNEYEAGATHETKSIFSLATITNQEDLERAAEVNLDRCTDEEIFGRNANDDDDGILVKVDKDGKTKERVADSDSDDDDQVDDDDNEQRQRRNRERDLEEAYSMYLENTKNASARQGTKAVKRSKKLQRLQVMNETMEDHELALQMPSSIAHETNQYVALLTKKKNQSNGDSSDDSSSDDDDDADDNDGFHDEPVAPEAHHQNADKKRKAVAVAAALSGSNNDGGSGKMNPLIHQFPDNESTAMKTARWFNQPLFATINKVAGEAEAAAATSSKSRAAAGEDREGGNSSSSDDDEDHVNESDDDAAADHESANNKKKVAAKKKRVGIDAAEVMAMMPKTDKQKRHERRLKQMERDERKKAKQAKRAAADDDDEVGGQTSGGFELVPSSSSSNSRRRCDGLDKDDSDMDGDGLLQGMSEERRKQVLEARDLIKAGMGKSPANNANGRNDKRNNKNSSEKIELVSQEETAKTGQPLLPVMDTRQYDSDHEDYDSDDYVQTLALGTMMLRRSKEKQFVDASYNRYAWNDPADLPDWFVDDENRHYRPQLPIPPALMAKMKERMMSLSQKPIAKVAEARARKNKRAKTKLAAAKKQAEAVANSTEMSESMKLRAISKALRGQETKRPGKSYVVAQKGQRGMKAGGKGLKVVDKRMKSDKRSMERKEKKRKKGKQGGLVGSKKRRHHK